MAMCRSKRELLMKLQSLINRYRGAENFVHMMDEWPKTIRELVFNSTPLMIRLGMLMPLSYEPMTSVDNEVGQEQLIYVVGSKSQAGSWRGMEKVSEEKFFIVQEEAKRYLSEMESDFRDSFAVFEVLCINRGIVK
jgi:hypothetical protein